MSVGDYAERLSIDQRKKLASTFKRDYDAAVAVPMPRVGSTDEHKILYGRIRRLDTLYKAYCEATWSSSSS